MVLFGIVDPPSPPTRVSARLQARRSSLDIQSIQPIPTQADMAESDSGYEQLPFLISSKSFRALPWFLASLQEGSVLCIEAGGALPKALRAVGHSINSRQLVESQFVLLYTEHLQLGQAEERNRRRGMLLGYACIKEARFNNSLAVPKLFASGFSAAQQLNWCDSVSRI